MKRFLCFIIMSLSFHGFGQTTWYIDINGKDTNSGSKEAPFKTVEYALSKIRTASAGDITLVLGSGIHYLQSTLLINPAILDGHRLHITGSSEKKSILSGANRINPSWEFWRNGIWKAYIGKGIKADQLYLNGKALPMARYPNIDSNARFFMGTSSEALSKQRIRKWVNPEGGYVHALHQAEWGDFHYKILRKASPDSLVLEGGWQNNRPSPMHSEHRFVENIWEELDAAGEWFYDDKKGILYLFPPDGTVLSKARLELSHLDKLIHLEGTEAAPIRAVRFSNLVFTGTNRTFMHPREPLLRSDWTINRSGAILVEGSENIQIENNRFLQLGGHAVFVSRYNRNCKIEGNHIYEIGGNAIAFVGDPTAVRSPLFQYEEQQKVEELDLIPGPKTNQYPSNCLAYDNLIHTIGQIEKQVAGIQISMAMDITVRHNTIYDVPRAGINIGDGCWGGHLIEFNDVFQTVLESGDHGAFNSWGRDRYWTPSIEQVDERVTTNPALPFLDIIKPITLRNNRFHCEHGWDIDLDDGSSNYFIYNNLCLNGGLKLREGYNRTVRNNILINNSFHPHVWYADSKDIFTQNIVTNPYAPIRIRNWGLRVDSNFFIQPKGLEAAQKLKTDMHSQTGDPLFNSRFSGDFSVQKNSAVLSTGFENFSMDQFGVISPTLKKIAAQPTIQEITLLQTHISGQLQVWLGATIKNIETLGEQSASGSPDKNGVLLVDVPVGSLAEKNKLKSGDIIRELNGQPISNMAALFTITQSIGWQGQTEGLVLQNQQLIKKTIHLK